MILPHNLDYVVKYNFVPEFKDFMEYIRTNQTILIILLLIFAVIAPIIISSIYMNLILPFLEERAYIKMKIKRAENYAEYRIWKKILKRFYIMQIPFLGRLLVKFLK